MFVNADDRGFFRSGCRGHTHQLPGQTPFTEKGTRLQHGDDHFFALRRAHGQLDLARLDIIHGVRRILLRKENPCLRACQHRFAVADLCEELLGIKLRHSLGFSDLLPLKAARAENHLFIRLAQSPWKSRPLSRF